MTTQRPSHIAMDQFKIEDNCLLVGGKKITQLAEELGQTPFYVYDSAVIDQQIQYVRNSMPDKLRLHYAIKANPLAALAKHMCALVDGFDVASIGEMNIALAAGMAANSISYASPGKSLQQLSAALSANITLNIESEAELNRLLEAAEQVGTRPKIAIRVNPDFQLKSSGMTMGGGPKPFGIDAERVPELLSKLPAYDIEFKGLHIFSGSQNLNAQAIIECQNKTIELAIRLSQQASTELQTLNMGGGFGIPYFPGDQRLDLQPIGENVADLQQTLKQQLGDVELIIELGRFLVGESGLYVTRIIEQKISRGQTFLITDGGMHHHLAASGNLGQIIRKNFPVAIANRMVADNRQNYTVVGPLCTPLDILANKMDLSPADAGDLIVVFQSGAYGLSASPVDFLSHPRPVEVFL